MSGWSVMTVSPPTGLSLEARERAEQAIEDQLAEMYPEHSGGYADRTVQLPRGTATYTEGQYGGTDVADETFDAIPEAKWIVIVDANDTSDSGTAEVYKRMDGETVPVYSVVGYEGARGRDVVGMVRDEYHVPSHASYEA